MTYRGHVRNGRVELDTAARLPEGAEVQIEVLAGSAGPAASGNGMRPIEDELAELAADVPESEWAKLPGDLGEQLDHYVYGARCR